MEGTPGPPQKLRSVQNPPVFDADSEFAPPTAFLTRNSNAQFQYRRDLRSGQIFVREHPASKLECP